MRNVARGLVGVLVCLVVGACSTLPPTDVTHDAATLNGAGIGGDAPTSFRFQLADTPDDLGTSRGRETGVVATLPAHAGYTELSTRVTGLTPGTTSFYRLCSREAGATAERCYDPPEQFHTANALDVFTAPALPLGRTHATLEGSVVSRVGAVTSWFAWAKAGVPLSGSQASRTPTRGPAAAADGISLHEQLDGLTAGTAYHARFCVQPPDGVTTCGEEETFTPGASASTLCTVQAGVRCGTRQPSAVGAATATFHGQYGDASDAPLTATFQYRRADTTGTWTTTASQPVPDAVAGQAWPSFASAPVTGLTVDTRYDARLCVRAQDSGAAPTCLDPWTFSTFTVGAGRVRVTGDSSSVNLDVTVAADGTIAPGSHASWTYPDRPDTIVTGSVTCASLQGRDAIVGVLPDGSTPFNYTTWFQVRDNAGVLPDWLRWSNVDGGQRWGDADCSPLSWESADGTVPLWSELRGRAVVVLAGN